MSSETTTAFFNLDDAVGVPVNAGIACKTLASGSEMTFCVFEIAPGSEIPEHSHAEEQTALLLSGTLEAIVDGEPHTLRPGHGYHAGSWVKHGPNRNPGPDTAVCVDVFSPARSGPPPFAQAEE
jgi:quercetin dioxygenase-like cupin family protein